MIVDPTKVDGYLRTRRALDQKLREIDRPEPTLEELRKRAEGELGIELTQVKGDALGRRNGN